MYEKYDDDFIPDERGPGMNPYREEPHDRGPEPIRDRPDPRYHERPSRGPPVHSRGMPRQTGQRTISKIAAYGAVIFFVGLLIAQMPHFYEEPHGYDYEFDEAEDYEKDVDEHEQAISMTVGLGRIISSAGLILAGYALFSGGIELDEIPENVRRAMIHGGALMIVSAIIATFLFTGLVF